MELAIRWGLAVLYLLLIMTLVLLFPPWLRPFLLALYAAYAAWSFWSQEASASRAMNLRPLTPEDVEDWVRLRKRLAEARAALGLVRDPWYAVARSRTANAMAVGGRRGVVIFTTALLHGLSEDELVAVAGHELKHLAGRDSLPLVLGCAWLRIVGAVLAAVDRIVEIEAPVFSFVAAAFGFVLYGALKIVSWVGDIFMAHRSRQQEHLADLADAQVTSAATMSAALRRLDELKPDTGEAKLAPWSPAWIAQRLNASHPPTEARIGYLAAAAERGEIRA